MDGKILDARRTALTLLTKAMIILDANNDMVVSANLSLGRDLLIALIKRDGETPR